MVVVNDAVPRTLQQLASHSLRICSVSSRISNTVVGWEIEGVQPVILVAPSTMQALEIGDPVRTEHHGLAVDDEVHLAQPKRGLGDQRVTTDQL